jgi:excisionase family DNA binding protein
LEFPLLANFDLTCAFGDTVPAGMAEPYEGSYRPHDLLTYDEAATEFRLHRRTLRTWRERGQIRSYRIGPRVMFRWIDVHDHIESLAVPAVKSGARKGGARS